MYKRQLWDGGDIRSRKRLTRAASEGELEKQHVDMYALTDRVNQLFFGILLLDEQLKQNSLLQEELGRTHKQVADYIANGIATLSDLDAVSYTHLTAAITNRCVWWVRNVASSPHRIMGLALIHI